MKYFGFNPRPRTAGDERRAERSAHGCRFNPRPRTAGDARNGATLRGVRRFNPRPRTAGDCERLCIARCDDVSIHARAQRATQRGCRVSRLQLVSIHARAQRATAFGFGGAGTALLFQSTPAHSGRRGARARREHRVCVSIHARAQRATTGVGILAKNLAFQSTPAHSGRRRTTVRRSSVISFQSTPAHSGRPEILGKCVIYRVSIHARAQRATTVSVKLMQRAWVSIHARAQRATHCWQHS